MSLVMVVEDEQMLRDSMVRSLRRLPGVEVVEAGRFSEARALMVEERPALVVSDVSLPDESGVGLLAELDRSNLHIPVIFVTAYLGRFRDRIPDRPGVEVFEKPLPMAVLREKVMQQLESSREHRRAPFTVAEYLQMAGIGRHSMTIRLVCAGECTGWLRIFRGQLWAARHGDLRGEEAVTELAFAADCSVEVEALAGEAGPREIHRSIDAVLLDACRRHDERLREQPDLDELLAALEASEVADFAVEATPPPPGFVLDDSLPPFSARPPAATMQPGPGDSIELLEYNEVEVVEVVEEEVAAEVEEIAPPDDGFNALMDEGLDALLARDYALAWRAFDEARRLRPEHPVVRANLTRLQQLGRAPIGGRRDDDLEIPNKFSKFP
ncbi:MAG: response regulator [Myxococcales bacterium]|nr:response regulator [Myxococcales bacterium]MCB9547933.1 response regulator [Myxococcales bacterium]